MIKGVKLPYLSPRPERSLPRSSMRYSLEHVSAKAKATHHAYLLQVSPLCRESTYESTKQILAEQKELRSALKYLNSELAVMIRDKTVSFMLSKQEREPLLQSTALRAPIVERQLEIGESKIRTLNAALAQHEQRLQFVSQNDAGLMLSRQIQQAKMLAEECRRDIRDQRRLNNIYSARSRPAPANQEKRTLSRLADDCAACDLRKHTLICKLAEVERSLSWVGESIQDSANATIPQEDEEATANKASTEGKARTVESLRNIVRHFNERMNRDYVRKAAELQKQGAVLAALSEKLAFLDKELQRTRQESSGFRGGVLSAALVVDRKGR